MYAVFESGGKQHKAKVGDTLKLEKIETGIGEAVVFDKVLLVSDDQTTTIGKPYVESATISAEVTAQARHKKVKILKFRRRQNSMKRQGHRQYYTAVKITEIKAS